MPWPPGPLYEEPPMTEDLAAKRMYEECVPDLARQLRLRAIQDAADYVTLHLDSNPGIFDIRDLMGHFLIDHFRHLKRGLWLEFGVWRGETINYFSCNLPRLTFYGFDSFVGLPEDWLGGGRPRTFFNEERAIPRVEPNVQIVPGLFADTLPQFTEGHKDELEDMAMLYIDSDLYSSAVTVLEHMRPYIKPGLFMVFDEYLGFPNWRKGEFKAWQEFCSKYGVRYRYRAFHGWMAFIEVTHGT